MADDDKDKVKQAQIELEKKVAENAVMEYKQKVLADRLASRTAELEEYMKEKNSEHPDRNGKPQSNWQVWQNKLAESHTINSTYDWRTLMTMLLGDLSAMVTAMNGSIKTSEFYKGIRATWDSRPVLLGVPSTDNIPLPNLEYGVRVTDAAGGNKLVIDPLVRTDKDDLPPQFQAAIDNLNKHFKEPVVAWLASRGYTVDPEDEDRYVDKHGQVLTPEIFAQLNVPSNDPENPTLTLDEALSEETDVSLTPRP